MHRHQIKNPWFERGTEAVFNTLTAPLAIVGDRIVGPLHRLRSVREMEFVYPIPESSHPLLAAAAQGAWTVERGYLKGFVDFVFEDHGSGLFRRLEERSVAIPTNRGAIQDHVRNHYRLQARIYSIGVIRLLQIRNRDDYEQRFGGLLYMFLRGMDGGGRRGVYFHRPPWDEICRLRGGPDGNGGRACRLSMDERYRHLGLTTAWMRYQAAERCSGRRRRIPPPFAPDRVRRRRA